MNKYQEALERLAGINVIHLQGHERQKRVEESDRHNDIETMFELVERATPKKPIGTLWSYCCPNCQSSEVVNENSGNNNFCGNCGQAIDWNNKTE